MPQSAVVIRITTPEKAERVGRWIARFCAVGAVLSAVLHQWMLLVLAGFGFSFCYLLGAAVAVAYRGRLALLGRAVEAPHTDAELAAWAADVASGEPAALDKLNVEVIRRLAQAEAAA